MSISTPTFAKLSKPHDFSLKYKPIEDLIQREIELVSPETFLDIKFNYHV